MVDVEDKSNREVYVLLLQYNVEKPENFSARVQEFAESMEEGELQPIFVVKIESDECIFSLIVMNCLEDNILRSSLSTLSSKKTWNFFLYFPFFNTHIEFEQRR